MVSAHAYPTFELTLCSCYQKLLPESENWGRVPEIPLLRVVPEASLRHTLLGMPEGSSITKAAITQVARG